MGVTCVLDFWAEAGASPQFPQAVSPVDMEHPHHAQAAACDNSSCVMITSRAAEV